MERYEEGLFEVKSLVGMSWDTPNRFESNQKVYFAVKRLQGKRTKVRSQGSTGAAIGGPNTRNTLNKKVFIKESKARDF